MALAQMAQEHDLTGTTPDDDMDVLAALTMAARARRILVLGTLWGGSAVVLLDLAAQNGDDARLTVLDVSPEMLQATHHYVSLAGHAERLTLALGSTHDPAVMRRFGDQVWDVIYLDTTHQYDETIRELDLIAEIAQPHTLVVMHDASIHAAETLDLRRQGGVRQALQEFVLFNPRWQTFTFEKPPFGQYGIALLQRRPLT